MHRLVQAQPFDVGPVEHRRALARASASGRSSVVNSTNFAFAVGSTALEQVAEREADPRNHHRPALDAAEPVDALLERVRLDEVVDVVTCRACRLRPRRDGPRARSCSDCGVSRRVVLVGAELVEVVVGRHLLVGRKCLALTPLAFLDVRQLCAFALRERIRRRNQVRDASRDGDGGCLDELATTEVVLPGSDVAPPKVWLAFDDHNESIDVERRHAVSNRRHIPAPGVVRAKQRAVPARRVAELMPETRDSPESRDLVRRRTEHCPACMGFAGPVAIGAGDVPVRPKNS